MTSWSQGYVADVPYVSGFHRETTPSHIAFAEVSLGKNPGRARRPTHILELGFGMGLNLIINAATNPSICFEGVDFNPAHVNHAQELIEEACLSNVTVKEASFQNLAHEAKEQQHDVDIIIVHGVLSWISVEAREAVIEITRKRLRPGGTLYVSYNSMPGWAPMLPLRNFVVENAKRSLNESDKQAVSGLELLKVIAGENALYFRENPNLQKYIENLAKQDGNYLAHEYMNADWFIFHFAEVADMFTRAKLSFIGSANILGNIDRFSIQGAVIARIAEEKNVIFKETLKDLFTNKKFRKDLFVRGAADSNRAETLGFLNDFRFVPTLPRSEMDFEVSTSLGVLEGDPTIYSAIADLLAEKTASFSEIAGLPVFQERDAASALQVLGVLIHSGQVLPILNTDHPPQGHSPDATIRLNKVLMRKVLQGRTYDFVATAVGQSAIQVKPIELLMLAAVTVSDIPDRETMTSYVLDAMARLDLKFLKNGQSIADVHERMVTVTADIDFFLADTLPVWRRLGVC